MELNGWIKLHRKILSSDDLFRSGHTFQVFVFLLLMADREGKLTIGRFQGAKWLKMKPSTFHDALIRLQTQHRVDLKPNNKSTSISICNWDRYQHQPDTNPTPIPTPIRHTTRKKKNTEKEEQENTDTNTISKEIVAKPPDKRNVGLQELLDFGTSKQFPLQGTAQYNRRAAWNVLKKYHLEPSKRLVEAATAVRGEPYAPRINDFGQLYKKAGDLVAFVQERTKKKGGHVKIS